MFFQLKTEPWMQEALCAQTGGEDFFPEKNDSTKARNAKALCNACPVRARCLQYALDNNEREGIWGATSARERARMRKQAAA